ncbi:MAG: tRNA modification GTPase MnmE [Planctomycetota bacterium]|jgi:tRNA modification GTPase
MLSPDDLIVAAATVPAPGCRAIVRLAGAELDRLLAALIVPESNAACAVTGGPPRLVTARLAAAGPLADFGQVPVAVLHWPGPGGPLGGPLAEVQLPGAPPLVEAVVAAACGHGARLARGGEFSLRAFLAGRMDLLQAEAVLAVVDARTPAELAQALSALAGGIGREVDLVRERLLDLTADIEAAIDFSDERTPDAVPTADAAAWAAVEERILAAAAAVEALAGRLAARDATATADLPRAVLVGPPNIGKSSLYNALLGRAAALVADEPGTTRDWLVARLDARADEPACLLIDVAGVVAATPAPNTVASLADRMAREEIARAEIVVVCHDAAAPAVSPPDHLPATALRVDVVTRCDAAATAAPATGLRTSSLSGAGIAELRAAILDAVTRLPPRSSPATQRLRGALDEAATALAAAREAAAPSGHAAGRDEAIVAGLVRAAVAAIGSATATDVGTELIDRIFSRHCIGK